ncbi:hypothetical protein TSOC_000495 [Tetrabaena socialis]|uniref:RING-type domain-containing protein n=1 Tax=Tetrabaena socialis TaxID=47790 RepID=A0A2J8AJ55_9CHLO|nr:hypothetical protein TSOC_000495 [Tetrabaena socialis]|eukprot:PNH12544.1 hypothetical protein TSOC_000495 [Tetrabaena socialis]
MSDSDLMMADHVSKKRKRDEDDDVDDNRESTLCKAIEEDNLAKVMDIMRYGPLFDVSFALLRATIEGKLEIVKAILLLCHPDQMPKHSTAFVYAFNHGLTDFVVALLKADKPIHSRDLQLVLDAVVAISNDNQSRHTQMTFDLLMGYKRLPDHVKENAIYFAASHGRVDNLEKLLTPDVADGIRITALVRTRYLNLNPTDLMYAIYAAGAQDADIAGVFAPKKAIMDANMETEVHGIVECIFKKVRFAQLDEDHKSCPICYDEMAFNSTYYVKGCAHAICTGCVLTWIQNCQAAQERPTCPVCRCVLRA